MAEIAVYSELTILDLRRLYDIISETKPDDPELNHLLEKLEKLFVDFDAASKENK